MRVGSFIGPFLSESPQIYFTSPPLVFARHTMLNMRYVVSTTLKHHLKLAGLSAVSSHIHPLFNPSNEGWKQPCRNSSMTPSCGKMLYVRRIELLESVPLLIQQLSLKISSTDASDTVVPAGCVFLLDESGGVQNSNALLDGPLGRIHVFGDGRGRGLKVVQLVAV